METAANIEDVIATLRAHRQELERQGVVHAAVFGSVARGDATPDSDVDILVEIDKQIVRTLFEYAGIQTYLEDVIGRPVDMANAARLKPHVRPSALAEAVNAF
jgi:predicted nucleotidyltransferase